MPYYVYILESERDGTLYKGFTENYFKRLQDHNKGFSEYTSRKIPWKLIYVEEHSSKKEALIRERKLKRCNKEHLKWLVDQPSNII